MPTTSVEPGVAAVVCSKRSCSSAGLPSTSRAAFARLRRAESWSVLAAVKLGDPAGLGQIADMPCLDLEVLASEVQDPFAPRRQVLRPLASHAPAGQDEEMLAVGYDEDRHLRRFAGLPAIGLEGDLALSAETTGTANGLKGGPAAQEMARYPII